MQINKVIIYHRNSCLPKLGISSIPAKQAWDNYSDVKYFSSIENYQADLAKRTEKATEKRRELAPEPEWMHLSIWLGMHMLKWRSSAQLAEKKEKNTVLEAHHKIRIQGSCPGPLFRPDTRYKPEITIPTSADENLEADLTELLDILGSTGCNWAGFHNKNSLVTKWIKIALASNEIRKKLYRYQILQDPTLRVVFSTFQKHLRKHNRNNTDLVKLTRLPKLLDPQKETAIPNLDSGIFYDDVSKIDQELRNGITSLNNLVMKYGTLADEKSMSTNVIKAYHQLAMVCTLHWLKFLNTV